jgi:hypothetical protein
MIDKLGILPQLSIKRSRRSRATLVESAMQPPIRGTSVCRMSQFQTTRLVFGHPAAIIDGAVQARAGPRFWSRGDEAADSRHLPAPNIPPKR